MSLQNSYTISIRPEEIADLRTLSNFNEFMSYFERDCKNFIVSCSNFRDLIISFSQIWNELDQMQVSDLYEVRAKQHSNLTRYRRNSIPEYVKLFWNEYHNRNAMVFQDVIEHIGRNISVPPSQEEWDSLKKDEQSIVLEASQQLDFNRIHFVVGISGLINSIFFALESECKIFCTLGCFDFALRYAQNKIIQHRDIWRALKRLGKVHRQVVPVTCTKCFIQKTCDFSINFEALANAYCYAIKVRMLADYDEFFFLTIEAWTSINIYFDKLIDVIDNQVIIKEKCWEKKP